MWQKHFQCDDEEVLILVKKYLLKVFKPLWDQEYSEILRNQLREIKSQIFLHFFFCEFLKNPALKHIMG